MDQSRSSSCTTQSRRWTKQRWCEQQIPLTPLMEGPQPHPDLDPVPQGMEMQRCGDGSQKESSWEVIREWFRVQRNIHRLNSNSSAAVVSVSSPYKLLYGDIECDSSNTSNNYSSFYNHDYHDDDDDDDTSSSHKYTNTSAAAKRQDMRLLLGVLACPLAPIPIDVSNNNSNSPTSPVDDYHRLPHIKDIPIERSTAHYIIQQYLAATGCLSLSRQLRSQKANITENKKKRNMYTTGTVKMRCCETEISSPPGKGGTLKTSGTSSLSSSSRSRSRSRSRSSTGAKPKVGCFVLWQMTPGMWSLELVVGGNKVLAGSDGKIVWRHTPWLGTHAAKGPQRPLRRIIQGLDPKGTARLFAKAQCLGEKRIGEEDCFVLKVAAERCDVMERNEGSAEVIRHVLYGYFSQKSGLLIYMEDSHLTRVQLIQHPGGVGGGGGGGGGGPYSNNYYCDINNDDDDDDDDHVYWETTIGSSIGDYRDVDGLMIAHQGRTVATVFRFGELMSMQHSRTTLEEVWRIDDIVFNVPGLSFDSFIPPSDIFHHH